MLDKKRKILRPVYLSPLITEDLNVHSIEHELLSNLLDLSRQELDESLLKTNLLNLLNQHFLLKNKKMALWHVDKKK